MSAWPKALALSVALASFMVVLFQAGRAAWASVELAPADPAWVNGDPVLAAGARLYRQTCAHCHGQDGSGASELARPAAGFAPRDLRTEPFRYISTQSGYASTDDIRRVIEEGIPAAGMPPASQLSGEQTDSLLQFVIALREHAGTVVGAGKDRVVLPPLEDLPRNRRQGKMVYERLCQACHGAQGSPDSTLRLTDSQGRPIVPRDLANGVFYGGAKETDLALRIRCGIPGTPMPAFGTQLLSNQDLADLLAFLASLVGSREVSAEGPNHAD